MAFPIRRLINPSDDELERTATALAEAFNWSFFIAGLDGDKSLVQPCIRAHVAAGVVGGEVYVAENPHGDIVGSAVWFGPGQHYLSTPEQRKQGWDELMTKLSKKCSAWWSKFWPAYDLMGERSFGRGVKTGSYHLQLIGVVPEYQRNGIASNLMQLVEQKGDVEHKPIVLETVGAKNISIYQGLGYKLVGEPGNFENAAGSPFQMVCLAKGIGFTS